MAITKKASVILGAIFIVPFLIVNTANADVLGQQEIFLTNEEYDQFGRVNLGATLRHVSQHAYFYVENKYWDDLSIIRQDTLEQKIRNLADEFDQNIYKKETQIWGPEANPGVDGDSRITILLEDVVKGNGGYFETINGYPKSISVESNEREMLTVSVEAVEFSFGFAKNFLAHEFQHLISFNQKDLLWNVYEDIWLNELRSEYTISAIGFNDIYEDSNLENRVRAFLENPTDSLTEWPNESVDYSAVAMFGEYLVEQYGIDILNETLKDEYTGITSINKFLKKKNYSENFEDLYTNWMAAIYLNDNEFNRRYGYFNINLKDINIDPQHRLHLNKATDSVIIHKSIKDWQPSWIELNVRNIPDNLAQNLRIEVIGPSDQNIIVSYIVYRDGLGPEVNRLNIVRGRGSNLIINSGGDVVRIVVMTTNGKKISDFGPSEPYHNFSIKLSSNFDAEVGEITGTYNYTDSIPTTSQLDLALKDGDLIKRSGESEIYVIWGKYKRYLRPEIINLYGHLNIKDAIEVPLDIFHSYQTSNYVKYVNDEKVYAVWPDGTRHWFNMTGEYFIGSRRDVNAIFIINELELNTYVLGVDITR